MKGVTNWRRGNVICFDEAARCWRYESDGVPIRDVQRPCVRCGRLPTAEGYDACLGHIAGVTSACCGHGVSPAYQIPQARVVSPVTGGGE